MQLTMDGVTYEWQGGYTVTVSRPAETGMGVVMTTFDAFVLNDDGDERPGDGYHDSKSLRWMIDRIITRHDEYTGEGTPDYRYVKPHPTVRDLQV